MRIYNNDLNKNNKILIIGGAVVFASILIATALIIRKKRIKNSRKTDKSKNYIIGDSQTPFIDKNSVRASTISEESGKESLWQGGKNLSWLKSAVEEYPKSEDVNAIIINIGTNGGFNKNEDINGLVNSIKSKFPNAMLFAVKGSWGWGGNKDKTEQQVIEYYDKFKSLGVKIIEPAIGNVNDPHGNLPIYKQIGEEIDKQLS